MISYVKVEEFFGKQLVELSIENNVLIITGDNGNGKTSLLNMIYYSLVGDVHKLVESPFKTIVINFDELYTDLDRITIEKKSLNEMEVSLGITYYYTNSHGSFKRKFEFNKMPTDKDSLNFRENSQIIFKVPISRSQDKSRKSKPRYLAVEKNETVLNVTKEIKDAKFYRKLLKLNESFLYFPTYRRIDVDILDFLKEDLSFGIQRRFEERIMMQKSLSTRDRRVIGISNQDISDILEAYSKEINQFTSESLDTLLREFVKELLKDVKNNSSEQELSNIPINELTKNDLTKHGVLETLSSVNNLLDLELNKAELIDIATHYSKSTRTLNWMLKDLESSDDSSERIESMVKMLANYFGWMNYILILEELYKKHLGKTSEMLESFNFISNNIKKFTNNKIKLIKKTNNEFEIRKNGQEISFEKLSTGEKQLFTFFVYTALHTKKKSSLVIIDEPELSLHVKWQDELMTSLLERENTTYLVATHSPFIIRDEEVRNHVVELIDGDFNE